MSVLTRKDVEEVASLLMLIGRKGVERHYNISEYALRVFKKKYMTNYIPPGRKVLFERDYYVYSSGRVWSISHHRYLRITVDNEGYHNVAIHLKMWRLNRLLLTCFKRPPKAGEQGCHNDGNVANNKLSNLRWGTAKDNAKDRDRHGTTVRGSRHFNAKLTERHVRILRRRFEAGEKDIVKRYAKRYGMDYASVWSAVTRKRWKHVI